eukprot:1387195-Alexandrium_andersonii.AAC.1
MVPDINDIDPDDDMDVDSDDLAPARLPGLARAGGLPQARVAALPAPTERKRIWRAQWEAPPPAG